MVDFMQLAIHSKHKTEKQMEEYRNLIFDFLHQRHLKISFISATEYGLFHNSDRKYRNPIFVQENEDKVLVAVLKDALFYNNQELSEDVRRMDEMLTRLDMDSGDWEADEYVLENHRQLLRHLMTYWNATQPVYIEPTEKE